ncbi:hypothetical protein GCM10009422_02590 [Brevundimonas kwangchunensis]|uniref:non-specific protein-tyrosine kinase n=1 Tax=Brevundimonas kwangchunensis TaxID=322163 RepID=A0ABN1GGQ2_9CAUL
MFGEGYAVKQGEQRYGSESPAGQAPNGSRWDNDAPSFDVAEYWRLALKHRFIILGTLITAIVLGVIATLLMTPIYTATTTVQIDREAARILDVDDGAPRESMVQGEEFFQTQYGLLRSRTLAERVVDDLGLATSPEFLEQFGVEVTPRGGETTAATTARRREAVLEIIKKNLGVAPVRGSRLVTVSFNSPAPELSSRVANAFAENFIQANLDRKYESSAYARRFLEERIAQTKLKLEEAERGLVGYATQQQIVNVQEANSSEGQTLSLAASNLSTLSSSLADARARRVAAQERWQVARSGSIMTIPDVVQNPSIQRLSEERAKFVAEYQQKLNLYQPEYPEMVQLKSRIDELSAQINTVAVGIRASIQSQYSAAANEETSLQRQVNGLVGEVLDLRGRSVQYNILQREVDTSRTLYDGLLQRYKEVGITGGVTSNNISIVDAAMPPAKPSKPQLILNLAIAAVLGLGLGLAAALIIEALDETLATPDDVESKLGLSVLGVAPLLEKGQNPRAALDDPRSGFSEAYYSLRTALQFSTPNGSPATMLVTSTRPAEGKSTTAYAVALNLSRTGKRVLLIDGDLRNPSMHRVIGRENEFGMSNILSGSMELAAAAVATDHQGLDFIACGPLPPNPAELWASDRLTRVLADAQAIYDHVVIDGPPVLGFADAPVLASAVSATVFVLESRGTRRAQARGAIRRLQVGRARLLGAVLTKFNTKTLQYGGYDYAYDYTYGTRDDASNTKKKR